MIRKFVEKFMQITPSEEDEYSIELVYSICKDAIQLQLQQRNSLETKAGTLMAFGGGIFAILMGSRETLIQLPQLSQILISLSVALFFTSLLSCTVVSWVRHYRIYPDIDTLAKNYIQHSEQETQLQLIANLIADWEANDIRLERNAKYLRIGFVSQTIAYSLIGLALFISMILR